MGSHSRAHDHPDGRAILYNEDTYRYSNAIDPTYPSNTEMLNLQCY